MSAPCNRIAWHRSAVLALLAIVLTAEVARASTHMVTSDFTRAGGAIDGDVYNLASMTASTSFITGYVTECSISGAGFGLTAFSSASAVSSSLNGFNLTMSGNTVTNASIRMQGYYPYHSTIMVSGTRATMLGTTPLYHFQNLVPQSYVIFYVQDTTVTWDHSGAGGAVLYLGGTERQLLKSYSGFYVVNTMATNAAHIMLQGTPICSVVFCIDVYEGLLSIDKATCNNCKGAFITTNGGGKSHNFLSGSQNGVMRFSNLTMTGNYPLLDSGAMTIFNIQKTGTFSMYGITTQSVLLRDPNTRKMTLGGVYSFAHISAAAFSRDGVRPNSASGTVRYGGNLTFGGKYMTSVADCAAYNLTVNYFVSPYSILLEKNTGTATLSTEVVKGPSAMFCSLSQSSTATLETMKGGWQRAKCVCPSGGTYYPPYCSLVFDPIEHYVYYTDQDVVTCTVANCAQCITGRPNECSTCNATFKLNGTSCVPKVCEAFSKATAAELARRIFIRRCGHRRDVH
ncbi:hypothetical protein STCU_10683 [Strigomonas culicis]|uniref:Surface antigen-like protein n=1 Tax=Strigomonas culicis TaxID=28005 RepID=S9URV1_9TRYP|nr:hypothetical protein STCU_10683 [Strigomonas culicis]|eukprot:EPY17336.1 hypothetical protein STCU_10683 [Strigomonas culicis]